MSTHDRSKDEDRSTTCDGSPWRTPRLDRRSVSAWLASVALGGTTLGAASVANARTQVNAKAAPDFTLRLLAGGNLRLAEQRGQVVMVNFWASWCAPCREEMPHLDRLYAKYRASGFTLLGVNVDDEVRNATGAAQRMGLSFPVLLDTDKTVVKLYGVSTMPSTVLIDRDGRQRHLHKGYKAGVEVTYEQLVRDLLKE